MTAEQLPGFLSEFAIFHDGGYKNNEGIKSFFERTKKMSLSDLFTNNWKTVFRKFHLLKMSLTY